MSNELRAPRRVIAKPRDRLLPILLMVVLLGAGIAIFLRDLAEGNPEAARSTPSGEPRLQPAPQIRQPAIVPLESAPQVGPAMDCGLVNGVHHCFPRSSLASDSHAPTAADEVNRAIAIMERGATPSSASRRPSVRARWISADDLLAAAEQFCVAARKEGTIAYRQCRASRWQYFRKSCMNLRGRLNMVGAEHYDELRAETDAYCEAEQRYHIVK